MTIRSPEDLMFLRHHVMELDSERPPDDTRAVESDLGNVAGAVFSWAGGSNSSALGAGSLAWGTSATARGFGSIAVGYNAVAEIAGAFVYSSRISTVWPPNALLFDDELSLCLECEVMISIQRLSASAVSGEYLFPHGRLECWCGWGQEFALTSGRDGPSADLDAMFLCGQIFGHERRRSLTNAKRDANLNIQSSVAFRVVESDNIAGVDRLFHAYRLAGRPLPVLADPESEDASRLLVWCDRLLESPTFDPSYSWWIERLVATAMTAAQQKRGLDGTRG